MLFRSRSNEEAIVIDRNGDSSRLASLTGGRTDYSILRYGELVSPASLRQYDVATYISGENCIEISTLRLTGRYDNAYPNTSAPSSITVMGHTFDVMPSATAMLSAFQLGDQITLLLTPDFQIAGAVSRATLRSDAVGIASIEGDQVPVPLMDGLTLRGSLERSSIDHPG